MAVDVPTKAPLAPSMEAPGGREPPDSVQVGDPPEKGTRLTRPADEAIVRSPLGEDSVPPATEISGGEQAVLGSLKPTARQTSLRSTVGCFDFFAGVFDG